MRARSGVAFRGRRTASYVQVTASDVATQVARRAGLAVGTVTATTTVYDHVGQAGETDWDFLARLARESEREILVRDGKFSFAAPTDATQAPAAGGSQQRNPLVLQLGLDLQRGGERTEAGGTAVGEHQRLRLAAQRIGDGVLRTLQLRRGPLQRLRPTRAHRRGRLADHAQGAARAGREVFGERLRAAHREAAAAVPGPSAQTDDHAREATAAARIARRPTLD